jgi:DNA-binding MarR family transcriptional regulator
MDTGTSTPLTETLQQQAETVERLLPELHRRLFALEPGQPITELPIPQLRLFVLLSAGPLSLSTIADRLDVSPSTVTQLADRLEEAHLVTRIAGAEDRRVKRLQMTGKGRTLLQARRERRVARVREAMARLSGEKREAVLHGLTALVDASLAESPAPIYEDPTGERTMV